MAITFPTSPTTNQVFTSGNKSWKWTGTEWIGNFTGSINADTIDTLDSTQFLRSDAADTATGALTLSGAVTLNNHLTWNTGKNIYVDGESSFDVRSGGTFAVWDGAASTVMIKATYGSQVQIGQAGSRGLYVYGTTTSDQFSGRITASGNGQTNTPFKLETDYSSYMVAAAGNTWGLFWAGNSGAAFGTNGAGGPGNIWGNTANPNEFVFVGSGNTKWTVDGNTGNTWQSGTLTTVGNITSGGDIITNSDERLKTNIRLIDNAIELVAGLSGKIYTKDGKDNQLGFIAQEVEEIIPELVHTQADEMGTKAVNYQAIVALLVEAVKDLNKKIETLEGKLNGV